jgi:carboxymethylenebutenolidase
MKAFMLCIVLFSFSLSDEKEKQSCCGTAALKDFAMFSENAMFVASHEAPKPMVFTAVEGEMQQVKTADGKEANMFYVASPNPTTKYLLVFHEWWGLNDYIKREAENLQKELGDVTVIAIDLYDGNVAADQQTAAKLSGETKEERARTIIQAVINAIGPNAKIATLGWCFGGGWSMQAALMLGKQAAACVMYYGMPEKDVKKLKTLQCDVLGIFGTQDGFISPKIVAEFEKNMKSAKKKLTVKNYNAVHAFANPSNPKYDKANADDAHAEAIKFLKTKFEIK